MLNQRPTNPFIRPENLQTDFLCVEKKVPGARLGCHQVSAAKQKTSWVGLFAANTRCLVVTTIKSYYKKTSTWLTLFAVLLWFKHQVPFSEFCRHLDKVQVFSSPLAVMSKVAGKDFF